MSRRRRAVVAGLLLVAVVVGGNVLAYGHKRPPPGWFLPAWLAVLAVDLVGWVRLPVELNVDQRSRTIGVRRLVGRERRWPVADVVAIAGNGWRRGVTFTVGGRRLRVLRGFVGFHHFIATVQSLNPTVAVSGV